VFLDQSHVLVAAVKSSEAEVPEVGPPAEFKDRKLVAPSAERLTAGHRDFADSWTVVQQVFVVGFVV